MEGFSDAVRRDRDIDAKNVGTHSCPNYFFLVGGCVPIPLMAVRPKQDKKNGDQKNEAYVQGLYNRQVWHRGM